VGADQERRIPKILLRNVRSTPEIPSVATKGKT
jgi:hypothetical protein